MYNTTVVPESKFTQILHKGGTKDRPDELTGVATEVGPEIAVKPGSAMDRALKKHRTRAYSDPEEEREAPNLTYQEVPGSTNPRQLKMLDKHQYANKLNTSSIPDYNNHHQAIPVNMSEEETKKADTKYRQTEKAEVMYDESLFLDKIKGFSMQDICNAPDIDEKAENLEFDITHVVPMRSPEGEEVFDSRGIPAFNKNAEIEAGAARQSESAEATEKAR